MKNLVKTSVVISTGLFLAGCDGKFSQGGVFKPKPDEPAKVESDSGSRPAARPAAVVAKPAATAHTAEQFDTTTAEQRAEAVVEARSGGARKLGVTIASLGNPAEAGFWIKTPLVNKAGKGRVEYPATGKSVAVDLIPIDGPKTAGSRVSLATLRLLGAPLAGLPELIVFAE
ncbi:hypothetical protein [Profundibacter amoris]|uniref:D-galactarate dehydratase n=1 Tax=Profundibacter amoris TaxID=2171755 RepID=A0A347UF52_9RHOB|nr:hypothetical protein [Profundibacter amoris]AXX97480.1 hypothetical protein BAR1_05730 [Profundibacter amoris]